MARPKVLELIDTILVGQHVSLALATQQSALRLGNLRLEVGLRPSLGLHLFQLFESLLFGLEFLAAFSLNLG